MNLEAEIRSKKLTKFLCQELMYEFVRGGLDPKRSKEMADYISGCHESKREFEKVRRAISFCESSAQLQVSPELHEALLRFEPAWQKKLREITLWSSQRGWRMLPYIFLVLTVVTGLLVYKPWQKRDKPDFTLAEQAKTESQAVGDPEAPPPQAQPEQPIVPPVVSANPQPSPVTPPPASAPTPPAPSVLKPPAETAAAVTAAAEEKPEEKPETKPSGFAYRSIMTVGDFATVRTAIKDKIIALGGKNAGTQELGWLKREGESYFHFALPESKLSELEMFLGTFSPVRFDKEAHPRVMPEGQIRIILTVKEDPVKAKEEAETTNEAPAETP